MNITDTYKQISNSLQALGIDIRIKSDKTIQILDSDKFKDLLYNLKNSDDFELFNSNKSVDNMLYEFHNKNTGYYIQLIGDLYNRSYKAVITIE